jgi:hypothetical protein
MVLRPEIIAELRMMLRDGATPARLVEFIRVAHGPERPWTALVMQYFFAAFGAGKIRVSARCEELQMAFSSAC